MSRRRGAPAAAALAAALLLAGGSGLPGALRLADALPAVAAAPAVQSQSPPPAAPDADEEAQRKQMEELNRQAREKREKARELKGQEQKVLKDLRSTETRLRRTRNTLSQLNRRERRLERDLGTVRRNLSRSERALAGQRDLLAARLRAMYKFGRQRELEFLLASESFAQLFARADFLVRVAHQDRRLLLGIHQQKERISANQDRLDRTLQEVESTSKRKQREQHQLNNLRSQKQKTVAAIQGEREMYEAAAEELERTARRIKSVLDELERRRRAEEEARRRGLPPGSVAPLEPYAGDFADARGKLPWPVRGEVVGQFGNEKHPKFGTVTFNSGIDIAAALGADIRAVARGRVDFVSNDYGSYGQMLILNHGDGYYTLYAHCSAVLVARGQEIESGQVIARVGDTGSLKGSILHFEVRKGRSALNPLEWLR